MAEPAPPLTSVRGNPARALTHLARLVTRYFDHRLSRLDITVASLPVLGALRETAQLSQKELTEIGQIGQPAMAQMLDRLMRQGLLERSVDTVDRRKAQFALSPRARDLMVQLESQLTEGNDEVFSVLSQEEFATLMRLASKLELHLTNLGSVGQ